MMIGKLLPWLCLLFRPYEAAREAFTKCPYHGRFDPRVFEKATRYEPVDFLQDEGGWGYVDYPEESGGRLIRPTRSTIARLSNWGSLPDQTRREL